VSCAGGTSDVPARARAGSTVKVGELAPVLAVKSRGTDSALRLAVHPPEGGGGRSTTMS